MIEVEGIFPVKQQVTDLVSYRKPLAVDGMRLIDAYDSTVTLPPHHAGKIAGMRLVLEVSAYERREFFDADWSLRDFGLLKKVASFPSG